ncbi:MAG: SDR family NAD(P)-dependent oxidoreductase, partial [Halobacteriovoraceae bacterium]|nr:SDR family NAD(P)-dependent oxidoreductase [Halobacteriovoraceae bacterium]
MSEKKQLAVVTGASSGIGLQMAHLLAGKGYNLILTARREDRLVKTADILRKKHSIEVFGVASDLIDPSSPLELYQECMKISRKSALPLTILINNAGMGQWKPFVDTSIKRQLRGIQLNIAALTELSYYFVRTMKEHGEQSYIMNVSSLVSFLPALNYAVYAASKAYVRHFSEVLCFELERTNIHVHCFCPGGTVSEFMNAAGQQTTKFASRGLMSAKKVAETGLGDM